MNIVYLLTNISKESGKRFYIGSKQECHLREINGINTIVSVSNGKPYYSSSSSIEMREEMKRGDVFEASILEQVSDRRNLLEREDYWINKYNAVKSSDYYNMSNAKLNCHDQEAVANKYGETVKELACRNSSWSKRDATARDCGFDNFGDFCFFLHECFQKGEGNAQVSKRFNKHKSFAKRILDNFDMVKALEDKNLDLVSEIREYIKNGCSLYYAAELLGIEIPAARCMLGDFDAVHSRAFSVARDRGKTKHELEIEITQQILDGKGFREVSTEYGIVYESVKRYFFRCIRRNLNGKELI